MNTFPIDIVIPWVDGNDPQWQEQFHHYSKKATSDDDNTFLRYRDWDNLQYIFRGIEKFLPWVNKVYLVTAGQKPAWLNTECSKLRLVFHDEFLPIEVLPTFSVRPIELNIHRLPGLSEHFIYFNDDFFVLDTMKPGDFFRNGYPCDMAVLNVIYPTGSREYVSLNNMGVINKHFKKNRVVRKYFCKYLNSRYVWGGYLFRTISLLQYKVFTGFYNPHAPQPYLKKTFEEVWQREHELLSEITKNKFRQKTDVNQSLFRYWQLVSGNFSPTHIERRQLHSSVNDPRAAEYIRHQRKKIAILNDAEVQDFERVKKAINSAFETILPERSSFELPC